MAIRRRPPTSDKAPPAPLPAAYDIFGPNSMVAEHLSATTYDDGGIRTPGQMRVAQRNGLYEVTVYDLDAGLRLPVTGPTIRACLDQLELFLGAQDAPWVVDDYLTGLLGRKNKKRK